MKGKWGTPKTHIVDAQRQVESNQIEIRLLWHESVTRRCQWIGKPDFQKGQMIPQVGCARVCTEVFAEGDRVLEIQGALLIHSLYAFPPEVQFKRRGKTIVPYSQPLD